MNKRVLKKIEEYVFKGSTVLDNDLFKSMPKSGIDGITMGNFTRSCIDRVRICTDITYPDLSYTTGLWSIHPDKQTIRAEIFILSKEEMMELINFVIEILEHPDDVVDEVDMEQLISSAGTL